MGEEEKQVESRRNPDGTWPDGVSGNPEGHKKGVPNYKARFRKHLEEMATWKAPLAKIEELKKEFSQIADDEMVERIEAARVHLAAMNGEEWALNRLHDRPAQSVDVTTNGDPITNNKWEFIVVNPEQKKEIAAPETEK